MSAKTLIVPQDFTLVADTALKHALVVAKTLNATIQLLHVVSKESQIPESLQKLEVIAQNNADSGVTIIPNVKIGNIFTDIGTFAAEHMAELIIMGTHGPHGWQHILGSNALKVVTSSPIPFIIVQEKVKDIKPSGYDLIVVPMDLQKETKQKLTIVASLAKYFNSEVHVVTPDESDDYLRNQVISNITFSKNFLVERNVNVKTSIIPSSGFEKEVVKYAASVGADLIAIMNLSGSGLFTLLSNNYEQYIITNDALIPTLILNPIEMLSESESGSIFSM